MARKNNCGIYGPDLTEHEMEGAKIAEEGLKLSRGKGVIGTEEKSDGPDASTSGSIDKLK